jgi:regulator of nucleoside diphosphate kinase
MQGLSRRGHSAMLPRLFFHPRQDFRVKLPKRRAPMANDRRIIVSENDLVFLRRLASHPHLAAELGKACVVDPREIPADVVTMNSRVLYEDASTGECREITIVYPQEANAARNFVSVLAPVGMALLGLAQGQSITWPLPGGTTRSLRVLKIVYQPEAEEAGPRAPRVP